MRCTGILVVLALAIGCAAAARDSPPEFSYDLYSDKQGHFSYDGAALALVQRPSHLQRVYADAARGEARPRQLIQELEYWFQQTGITVADRTAAPGCLVLPELQSNCRLPNWGFIEQFLGNSPEGVRLREVLAEAYARRAHELGVRNEVTVAGVNLLLVGSLAKAVLARVGVVPEAKAAAGGPKATIPYKRPSGATTSAQRASVQGKPCVDCGGVTPKQVADHKTPLVKEHYQTGTIDTTRMRSVDAVQPQCPTCSARQGADMSRYSREQRRLMEGN